MATHTMGTSTLIQPKQYCPSLTRYERWRTREVRIGDIGIGGSHPIRGQRMTAPDTKEKAATVVQRIRMNLPCWYFMHNT